MYFIMNHEQKRFARQMLRTIINVYNFHEVFLLKTQNHFTFLSFSFLCFRFTFIFLRRFRKTLQYAQCFKSVSSWIFHSLSFACQKMFFIRFVVLLLRQQSRNNVNMRMLQQSRIIRSFFYQQTKRTINKQSRNFVSCMNEKLLIDYTTKKRR